MNAELVAIRDSLRCGHCGGIFQGSDSQAWKVKYEHATVYCSPTCRHAAMRNKFSSPVPNRGPCPTCNKTFFSRKAKIYCSMACYIASGQFSAVQKAAVAASLTKEAREKNAARQRTGSVIKCVECGEEFYCKPSTKRKFCTASCYRSYMAKRFDRWIANPEGLSLPQCYDEFLDREELTCLVDGCGWRGSHLTLHMNQAHGVPSGEFKRAAGFNLGTGVVAKQVAQACRDAALQRIALQDDRGRSQMLRAREKSNTHAVRYVASEAREHKIKARALLNYEPGPIRVCVGCGKEFKQRHASGRALYCTVECRRQAYAAKSRSETPRHRDPIGRYTKLNPKE